MKKRYLFILFFILLFPTVFFLSHNKSSRYYPPLLPSFSNIPNRSEQPQDTLVAKAAIPIHHWKTKQETPVYFTPTEKLQMIDIIITFDAGSSRDGDQFGLAAFLTSMLDEGTETKSDFQIAKAFEDVGAIFDSSTDRDKTTIQLRAIVEDNLLSTIDLLAEVIAKPNLSDKAIQHVKTQTLMSLKNEIQQPSIKALTAFYQDSYGKHPYGHLPSGTITGIENISRQDLINFHQQYFVAKNAIITIVGGIHRDNAIEIAERITAVLPKGKTPAPLPAVEPLKEAVYTHITLPLQQTHVILGQPCCAQNDPDYFSLMVGNYILGEGPFVARLFKEIREKNGMAYSVNSSFRRLKKAGPFLVVLQTQAKYAKEAENIVKQTLKEFIEQGPTEEEVLAAKRGIIGGFPLSIGNNGQIANVVSDMTFYGLPIDFLDTFREKVAAITVEDIQTTFQRKLNPDKMVLVSVGE